MNEPRALSWLRRLPHSELGWPEIHEEFTRYTLLQTPWFRVYLHRLKATEAHERCHDHPWSFVAILLAGGYHELHGGAWTWRRPGSVLYRPAEFDHVVVTEGVSWSICLVGRKRRKWGFLECRP